MSSYRPIDSKREEFRKYLEKAGAMDALTKVLVMLYDEPEKPADALEYIRKHLGDNRPDDAELNVIKTDLEEARLKIQSLEDEINLLKERLAQYEPIEDQPTTTLTSEKFPESEEPAAEGEGTSARMSGPMSAGPMSAGPMSAGPMSAGPMSGHISAQPSGEAAGTSGTPGPSSVQELPPEQ